MLKTVKKIMNPGTMAVHGAANIWSNAFFNMFPQVAVLSGLFELIRGLGLYNRLPGLVLAYLIFTLPFTVWVLTSFMRGLPVELEEAAIMDGAGPLTTVPCAAVGSLLPHCRAESRFAP